MPPPITIAIPTCNRVIFLREALESATHQTLSGIEIIASDNASTDRTPELVAEYKDRVIYHRNETNIGPHANFRKVFEISHGQIFTWLQDDDLIHEDFARRAVTAFQRYPNLKAYLTFAYWTSLPNCHLGGAVFGPPCGGDWMRKDGLQVISGTIVPALSLFVTVGFCPAAAFERRALAKAMVYLKDEYWLLMERCVLSAAVADGAVAIDPYIGGVYRAHPDQVSAAPQADRAMVRAHWQLMARDLAEIARGLPSSWKTDFTAILPSIRMDYRLRWAKETLDWPEDNSFCQEVKACLMASIPESMWPDLRKTSKLKVGARLLTPPIIWKGLSAIKSRFPQMRPRRL